MRLKVLNSHAAYARFLAECAADPVGEIPRPDVPQPYSYSETQTVWAWRGQPVVVIETRHKRYEVFSAEVGS